MFEKIRGLQLLVRKNEGLDAKQTVPGSNGDVGGDVTLKKKVGYTLRFFDTIIFWKVKRSVM